MTSINPALVVSTGLAAELIAKLDEGERAGRQDGADAARLARATGDGVQARLTS